MINKKFLLLSLSRSEYSLALNIYREIRNKLPFEFIISGSHHLDTFGNSHKEIQKSKFHKIKSLNLFLKKKTKDTKEVFNLVFKKFSEIFKKEKYTAIILIGDRYEALAVALASFMNSIPIIHYHGGEKTLGSKDDIYRICISKLSHLHFVAHVDYRKRLIQLGEDPKLIYCVGALGLDSIKNIKDVSKKNIELKYGIEFRRHNFLINFHPCKYQSLILKNLLKTLTKFKNTSLIFTSPSFDDGHIEIINEINSFVKKNYNAYYIQNFGDNYFLPTMNKCNLIIGNSSSGILEAPFLKKFVVNLGDRQQGRIMSKNITNLSGKSSGEIYSKIKQKLKQKPIKEKLFGTGNASIKSVKIIQNKINYLDKKLVNKKFFDLNF